MSAVPKRALVRPLVAALEAGRLKVARGLPAGEALVRELRAFRRQVSAKGHDTYEGAGEHDDLVIAAALAVWWRAGRPRQAGAAAHRRRFEVFEWAGPASTTASC